MTSSFNNMNYAIEPETPAPGGDLEADDIGWDDASDDPGSEPVSAGGIDDFDLGFDFNDAETPDRSGLGALVNSSFVAHQKLPVLDLILDRATRRMSTSLRHLTDENAEVTLDDVTTIRFSEFLDNADTQSLFGVLRSDGLGGYGLLVAETDLVLTIVDLLLGGRRGAMAWAQEGRAFTAIELGLAERLMSTIIGDIDQAFQPVIETGFHLERIETARRFASITQEASACIIAKFRIRLGGLQARAALILPHAVLDEVRDLLARDFVGEAGFGPGLMRADAATDSPARSAGHAGHAGHAGTFDRARMAISAQSPAWQARLQAGVHRGAVTVRAVLAERIMTIGDLSSLAVGDRLDFSTLPQRLARLSVGGCDIAYGRVGRLGDRLAVRIGHHAADEHPAMLSQETDDAPADDHARAGEHEQADDHETDDRDLAMARFAHRGAAPQRMAVKT